MPEVLKHRLRNGVPCLGTFVQIGAPSVVEILGMAGFDFAIVDLEHGALEVTEAQALVRAADTFDLPLIARLPLGRLSSTSALLDSGYAGLLIPQVRNADDVREAVRHARYTPLGERGACAGIRADKFGAIPWAEHLADADRTTIVAVTIENRQALENLDEIVRVPGVDVVFIGLFDLSSSLGHGGEPGHPEVLATVDTIQAAVEGTGVALGAWAPSPDAAVSWVERGMTFLPVMTDTLLWAQSCRSLHANWLTVTQGLNGTAVGAAAAGLQSE